MFLYLVQHAEAVAKEADPQRPLSAKGLAEIQRVAAFADRNCHITAGRICHSGKLRARQSAEIIATALHLPAPVRVDNLEPLADPVVWQNRLVQNVEDLLLVGHLPHLGRLASILLCAASASDVVQFRMGGIVALKRDHDRWALQWMITPDLL